MIFIDNFVSKLQEICATGNKEINIGRLIHDLIVTLEPSVTVSKNPDVSKNGGPDLFVRNGELSIAYIVLTDLNLKLGCLDWTDRRRKEKLQDGLGNFIHTNGLAWRFYRNGQRIASVTIAEFSGAFRARPKAFAALKRHLADFARNRAEPLDCPNQIAPRVGAYAAIFKTGLATIFEREKDSLASIASASTSFPNYVDQDLNPFRFVRAYGEAIALSMFASRVQMDDDTTFSWANFLEAFAKSNPLIAGYFDFVGGLHLDPLIAWIVHDYAGFLCSTDRAVLIAAVISTDIQPNEFNDFYGCFRRHSVKREQSKLLSMHVIPGPVANFLVRALDEVLRCEFGLLDGLANTSTVLVKRNVGQGALTGGSGVIQTTDQRVQVLDPFAGLGTYLTEVVQELARKNAKNNKSMADYEEREALPRLSGFVDELGAYSIACLRLGLALEQIGLPKSKTATLKILHLADALRLHQAAVADQLYTQLVHRKADHFVEPKADSPIICVIGTPPQFGRRTDTNPWILELFNDYITEPESKGQLVPAYPARIKDDSIKYIRFAEHLVETAGQGIMAFATNHAFLHYPNYRVMRKHLLMTFEKIYVLDLYGNPNKKPQKPADEKDESVFETGQGVAIIIGVKTKPKLESAALAKVFLGEVLGSRAMKLKVLSEATLSSAMFARTEIDGPDYVMNLQHRRNSSSSNSLDVSR